MVTVKRRRGIGVVQDPQDALYGDMPSAAIEANQVDFVVPASKMPDLLQTLVGQEVEERMGISLTPAEESSENKNLQGSEGELPGPPAGLSCPECGGSLWARQLDQFTQYQCHVGHAFSEHSLLDANAENVEAALWTALRVLKERVVMFRRLAEKIRGPSQARFEEQLKEAEGRANLLQRVLRSGKFTGPDPSSERSRLNRVSAMSRPSSFM